MTWKKPEDLSDTDLKYALAYLIQRVQDIEVTLAAAVAMILAAHEEIDQPDDVEYADTVEGLKGFLSDATHHLQQFNDAHEQLRAQEHSRN